MSLKKIMLVSSGQPSLNPRLVKEANALADAGYDVIVFYAYWNEWGTRYDEHLLTQSKWKAVRVGGAPTEGRLTYFISRLIFKIGQLINRSVFAIWGSSRAARHLINEVKKHKADLYIAHNLGALPAACIAAKKHGKPCGFDAEDFHRHEVTNDEADPDVIRKSIVENTYIPRVSYITASSPQIAELYQNLFPNLTPTVLLNVFNKTSIPPLKVNKPLKLFWFSQTIGTNRGIEDVVKALNNLNPYTFELHLLGNHSVNDYFITQVRTTNCIVQLHKPVSPDTIVTLATQFDIGLALEPGFSQNNDAALSNKLFTYMQAGLAIIATQTTAQAAFMRENAAIGRTYKSGDVKHLTAILNDYLHDTQKLLNCKKASLQLAHEKYNWEVESQKFLALVAKTL